jgi:uncharacterized membrane protein (DUF373 family)
MRDELHPRGDPRNGDFHQALRRFFELAQDVIVVSLCLIVLAIMAQSIWTLGRFALVEGREALVVLSQIVLLLILIELFRTLLFYLSEHRVSVSLMLEVAIVSELREVVLSPPTASNVQQIYGNTLLLAVLGALLIADRYLSGRRQLLHRREPSRPPPHQSSVS